MSLGRVSVSPSFTVSFRRRFRGVVFDASFLLLFVGCRFAGARPCSGSGDTDGIGGPDLELARERDRELSTKDTALERGSIVLEVVGVGRASMVEVVVLVKENASRSTGPIAVGKHSKRDLEIR